jgi:integrase
MALTDSIVRNSKPTEKKYKISDTMGMYLQVMPTGHRYWRLKYRHDGKEKVLALGVYPEVTLKEAREKRDQARKLIKDGINPIEVKAEQRQRALLESENSFESIAREWYENQKQRWTERHATYVLRRLEADIFKPLGYRPIKDITAPDLLNVLRSIEKRGAVDIAKRILQTSGQIFRYAIATGRAERDISADLKGALQTRKKENFAHLEESEMPEFLSKLENYDGDLQTKLAFKFLVLTFVRTTELRGATWDEINFEKKEWRIPKERMKMNELHVVPLSEEALAILAELAPLTGHREYIFPNRNNPRTFISENTLLYALYRMGYHSRATTHGFRATASTILNENGFTPDVIERQLAHSERNKVRASYNHAQYLPERRAMMQWWGNYLTRTGLKT